MYTLGRSLIYLWANTVAIHTRIYTCEQFRVDSWPDLHSVHTEDLHPGAGRTCNVHRNIFCRVTVQTTAPPKHTAEYAKRTVPRPLPHLGLVMFWPALTVLERGTETPSSLSVKVNGEGIQFTKKGSEMALGDQGRTF